MQAWWATLASVVVLLIVYGVVRSHLTDRKKRSWQRKKLPPVPDFFDRARRYNVVLSDGRVYARVRLAGVTDVPEGQELLGHWGNMLIVEWPDGRRAMIRPGAVRCVEEADGPPAEPAG